MKEAGSTFIVWPSSALIRVICGYSLSAAAAFGCAAPLSDPRAAAVDWKAQAETLARDTARLHARDGGEADCADSRVLAGGQLYLAPEALRTALALVGADPWLEDLLRAGESRTEVASGEVLLGVGDNAATARLLAAVEWLVRRGGLVAGRLYRSEVAQGAHRRLEESWSALALVSQGAFDELQRRLKLLALHYQEPLTWASFTLSPDDEKAVLVTLSARPVPYFALAVRGGFIQGRQSPRGRWALSRGPDLPGRLPEPGMTKLSRSYRAEDAASNGAAAGEVLTEESTVFLLPGHGAPVDLAREGAPLLANSVGAVTAFSVAPMIPGMPSLSRRLGEAGALQGMLNRRDSPVQNLLRSHQRENGSHTESAGRVLIDCAGPAFEHLMASLTRVESAPDFHHPLHAPRQMLALTFRSSVSGFSDAASRPLESALEAFAAIEALLDGSSTH